MKYLWAKRGKSSNNFAACLFRGHAFRRQAISRSTALRCGAVGGVVDTQLSRPLVTSVGNQWQIVVGVFFLIQRAGERRLRPHYSKIALRVCWKFEFCVFDLAYEYILTGACFAPFSFAAVLYCSRDPAGPSDRPGL